MAARSVALFSLTAGSSGSSGGYQMKMSKPRLAMALLTSIGALAFSGIAASTPANDAASAVAQTTLSEADASLEVSAQGRRGGGSVSFGRTGGGRQGGNVGRMGRQGTPSHRPPS